MANITTENYRNQVSAWSYWSSMRKSLTYYIQRGLNCSELLKELLAAKQAITQKNGSSKKAKQLWGTYVEKATKGIETIEYVEKLLAAFVENDFKVPTTEMVNSGSIQEEISKEPRIFPKKMKPEAVEICKDFDPNWNYWDSVKKARRLFLKWELKSAEILRELWIAKQAITKGGTRKSGLPKKGEMSWNKFVEEVFQGYISKKKIDDNLAEYVENGFQLPEKKKDEIISDPKKMIMKSFSKEANGRIKMEIYLPEFDTTYFQYPKC